MDIVSLPIEFDPEKIDSRFRIVAIASQRARELAFGAKPKIVTKGKKIPTIALEETLEGALEFCIGEEAREKLAEASKFDYKRFLEEKRKETISEDLSELERDLRTYLHEREGTERSAMLEELFADDSKDAEAENEEQS